MCAACIIIVTPVIIVQHLVSEALRLLIAVKGGIAEMHTLIFACLKMNRNQCRPYHTIVIMVTMM